MKVNFKMKMDAKHFARLVQIACEHYANLKMENDYQHENQEAITAFWEAFKNSVGK